MRVAGSEWREIGPTREGMPQAHREWPWGMVHVVTRMSNDYNWKCMRSKRKRDSIGTREHPSSQVNGHHCENGATDIMRTEMGPLPREDGKIGMDRPQRSCPVHSLGDQRQARHFCPIVLDTQGRNHASTIPSLETVKHTNRCRATKARSARSMTKD